MVAPARGSATFEDLLARDDADRLEIIGGEIVQKATSSPGHSFGQVKLAGPRSFQSPVWPWRPGGWWLFTGIHVGYPRGEVYSHDAAGWRRDRVPERPTEWPVRIRPDWVCEIVSPKHERNDLVVKPRVLHSAEVPHYWILYPEESCCSFTAGRPTATRSYRARPPARHSAPSRSR